MEFVGERFQGLRLATLVCAMCIVFLQIAMGRYIAYVTKSQSTFVRVYAKTGSRESEIASQLADLASSLQVPFQPFFSCIPSSYFQLNMGFEDVITA